MFPEIRKKQKDVQEILDEEEESFSRTLDRGEKLFERFAQQAKVNGWRLYDTFGFPVDLTRLMADENELVINEEEFEKAKAEAKEASKRKKTTGGEEVLKLDVHDLGKLENMNEVPKTDDRYKYGSFLLHHYVELGN